MQYISHSRLLYKERSYLKSLRTATAFFAKYISGLHRYLGALTFLMSFVAVLPLAFLPWATRSGDISAMALFLVMLCFLLLSSVVIFWFRGGNYAYMQHYFMTGGVVRNLREMKQKTIFRYGMRYLLVNMLLRFPYFIVLCSVVQSLSSSDNWVLNLLVCVLLLVVSLYLHVVYVLLEFTYVYEQRPLKTCLKIAFKQGVLRWGQLFLVSFFSEMASLVMSLAFALPCIIVVLAMDNALALEWISQEAQSIPLVAHVLLVLFGGIALAGILMASMYALWANTLQCGSTLYKIRTKLD